MPIANVVELKAPFSPDDEAELEELPPLEDEEAYKGPTASELREEAEAYRASFEREKEAMKSSARLEAEKIVREAEAKAAALLAEKQAELLPLERDAQKSAEEIKSAAETEVQKLKDEANAALASEKKAARDEGFDAGHDEGYEGGKAEVERLIGRTRKILEETQNRRFEMLDEAEQQIVDLALLIARRVVKVSLNGDRAEAVRNNIMEALAKVRSKGNVTIKVNLADLQLATAHTDEFVKLIERNAGGDGGIKVTVHEDSSVDEGGCVVSTDFGEIDARLASQLAEMERRILEISPLRG
jgi:flagellar assembly protein FliH